MRCGGEEVTHGPLERAVAERERDINVVRRKMVLIRSSRYNSSLHDWQCAGNTTL